MRQENLPENTMDMAMEAAEVDEPEQTEDYLADEE